MSKKIRSCAPFIIFFLIYNVCIGQTIKLLQQGRQTSIRGLSVVDDSIAWLSGSNGTVAVTQNGGNTWRWQQVKGFEKADFRAIEAFSNKDAIIMSSGTPALILKTIDGGLSWQLKYKNTDTSYFFDAMDFENPKHGYALGDPIGGKFVLMETVDGGETWHPFKNAPNALPGEAAFAASGTCLRANKNRVTGQEQIIVVTGGSTSRELVFHNDSSAGFWKYRNSSVRHGNPSQGAFSIAYGDCEIIVGGDYQKDKLTDSVAEYLRHKGIYSGGRWRLAKTPPSGFQSCVEFISGKIFLSTGTPGSNITTDGGKTWKQIDKASYNVCRKAKKGRLVLLAGNNGAIGLLKL